MIDRWHIPDPIRFRESLQVTIQALGWRSMLEEKRRYLPLQDDTVSTACSGINPNPTTVSGTG